MKTKITRSMMIILLFTLPICLDLLPLRAAPAEKPKRESCARTFDKGSTPADFGIDEDLLTYLGRKGLEESYQNGLPNFLAAIQSAPDFIFDGLDLMRSI